MSKKVKLLKGIGILCSVVLLSSSVGSISVLASDNICSDDTYKTSEVAAYASDELPSEMEEFYVHMMFGNGLQEGEERVLGTLNGEEFCVRVSDVTESSPVTYSSSITDSAVFTFYTKNILGIKKDVLKVTSECTWIKGSKIINLHCEYTALVSDIICSWDDTFKQATDTFHNLALDITYAGKSQTVYFGAGLSVDRQTLTLDCSKDYEL